MHLNKKWQFFSGYKFLWLLIFNTIFFIAVASLLPSRFESNDDVFMLLFASGKYTGTPESHLVFINYLYGVFLQLFYKWNNNVEWYSLIFAFFHIISISVIAWFILLKNNFQLLYKILFLIVFYSLELRFIMLFQFTTTSGLCAVAGLLLIAEGKRYQNYFGITLFVVGALIRLEAALLILIIMSPVFLRDINLNSSKKGLRPVFFLFFALLIVGVSTYIDYHKYQQNPEWTYYIQYNDARGKINDNPFSWKIKIPKNIPSYDYSLLQTFFPDGHVVDLKKLLAVKKRLTDFSITAKIKHVLPAFRGFEMIILIVLAIYCLILLSPIDKKRKLILLLSICLFSLCFFYISTFGSIKSRVLLPALMALFMIIVMTFDETQLTGGVIKNSVLICLSIFIIYFSRQTVIYKKLDSKIWKTDFAQQKELLSSYLAKPGNTIVPFAGSYTLEYYFPFSNHDFKTHKIFFSGWETNIPYNKTFLDSYLDIIDRHAIFFSKESYSKAVILLEKSILNNYGIHVIPEIQLQSEDYIIVKLKNNSIEKF